MPLNAAESWTGDRTILYLLYGTTGSRRLNESATSNSDDIGSNDARVQRLLCTDAFRSSRCWAGMYVPYSFDGGIPGSDENVPVHPFRKHYLDQGVLRGWEGLLAIIVEDEMQIPRDVSRLGDRNATNGYDQARWCSNVLSLKGILWMLTICLVARALCARPRSTSPDADMVNQRQDCIAR